MCVRVCVCAWGVCLCVVYLRGVCVLSVVIRVCVFALYVCGVCGGCVFCFVYICVWVVVSVV